MLISYKNKFIFIHNYKVAGSSITQTLRPYGIKNPTYHHNINKLIERSFLNKFEINRKIVDKTLNKMNNKSIPSHITAPKLKEMLPEKIWSNFFKFGFVRNPWDWQVSLYYYMLQTPKHHQHELIKSMNSFQKYIEWRVNQDKHLQKEFFYDENDNCLVNFIGKIENLEEDFQRICEKLNIQTKIPHSNKSTRKIDYREYYNEYTKNLIAENFKEDIELFDYEF
jgi:hypothetical protein